MASNDGLKVVALISGGKDSIFSILHCRTLGHEVVALANLYPDESSQLQAVSSLSLGKDGTIRSDDELGELKLSIETDIDSFMYQTVGHSIIPFYSTALGIPLYRYPITGITRDISREYGSPSSHANTIDDSEEEHDETEDLVPLLRHVIIAHPEVNAVSTGAILSTYQRTRVESVALRLGLMPLSYLWQFPYLPPYRDTSLLQDMDAVGLDARIIKVASGALDEKILGTKISEKRGWQKVQRAMMKFASAGMMDLNDSFEVGAVLGEGGEFETLAIDGPKDLFKASIQLGDTQIVIGEGGSANLAWKRAKTIPKTLDENTAIVVPRQPALFDVVFEALFNAGSLNNTAELIANGKTAADGASSQRRESSGTSLPLRQGVRRSGSVLRISNLTSPRFIGAADQLYGILGDLAVSLRDIGLIMPWKTADAPLLEPVIHSTLLLRNMADFSAVNSVYSTFFDYTLPPSRVTVACGSALPDGVAVSLSVMVRERGVAVRLGDHVTGKGEDQNRLGLHVQSRSYWAPANIGPYSQARTVPLQNYSDATTEEGSKLQLMHVAGQIPLIPATMELATAHALPHHLAGTCGNFTVEVALALQHLLRVGQATGIRWFTGAIAVISQTDSPREGRSRALIAGKAWRGIHRSAYVQHQSVISRSSSTDVDELKDDEVVDVWDLKNGMGRYSLAAEDTFDRDLSASDRDTRTGRELPDYAWVQEAAAREMIPSCYIVQVSELPRGAAVEWCSSGIGSEATSFPNQTDTRKKPLSSTHVEEDGMTTDELLVDLFSDDHSVSGHSNPSGNTIRFITTGMMMRNHSQRVKADHHLQRFLKSRMPQGTQPVEGLLTLYIPTETTIDGDSKAVILESGAMVVPCHRIWTADGAEVAFLAVEECGFQKTL